MDDLTSKVQDSTAQLADQAKNAVSQQVDRQAANIGNILSDHAQGLHSAAQTLREQGTSPAVVLIAEQVGNQVERLGTYLSATSGDELLENLEDFARTQPWYVAAGGFVLGLAISRSLKASSAQRYRSRYGTNSGSYGSYGSPGAYTSPMARGGA